MTCLLDVELCAEVVKGVDDVLAGLDVDLGAVFSLVEELFAVVKCVGDVLAGRGAGFGLVLGVKDVVDVLAGVEQGAYGGVYGDWAVVVGFCGGAAVRTLR